MASYYEPTTAFLTYSIRINHHWYDAYISAIECSYNQEYAHKLLRKACSDYDMDITFDRPTLYVPTNKRLCRIYNESWETEEIRKFMKKIIRENPNHSESDLAVLLNNRLNVNCPYVKSSDCSLLKYRTISPGGNDWFNIRRYKVLDKYNSYKSLFLFTCNPPYGTIEIRNDGVYTSSNGRLNAISEILKQCSSITF